MKILYICTHNRCRSILSEALTNQLGQGIITAASAGSQPAGEVHPLTLKTLAQWQIPTDSLCSESWNDKRDFKPDLVVTVCDAAAGEVCPLWMGETRMVHWGLPDPSKIDGDEAEVAAAFQQVMKTIELRVNRLLEALKNRDLRPLSPQGLSALGIERL